MTIEALKKVVDLIESVSWFGVPELAKAVSIANQAIAEAEKQEFDLRGVLASELKCWHRLTGEETQNLLDFVRKMQPDAEKQVTGEWKLVPIKPTEEMLKAMDECSTEGYDERLYAGHAASVYMAAVDVAPSPPQLEQEPVAGFFSREAMAAHCDAHRALSSRTQPTQPEAEKQEPVAWSGDPSTQDYASTQQEPVALKIVKGELCYKSNEDDQSFGMWCPVTPNSDLRFAEGQQFYTSPPQRQPLTDEQVNRMANSKAVNGWLTSSTLRAAYKIGIADAEAAHGIKGAA